MEVLKTLMEKVVSLPFGRQKEIKAMAVAAVCIAKGSLAKHRTVLPQMVFGVAALYLYFSSGRLPAVHVKEQGATPAAHRKNNYSDHR